MANIEPNGDTYIIQKEAEPGRTSGESGGETGADGESGTGQSPSQKVPGLPKGIPKWLANERVILYAWFIAMVIVGFDEWHNYHLLPRPARLWYTSLTFGLLLLLGIVPQLRVLANALAIGYVITLLWQYYNGQGQFA